MKLFVSVLVVVFTFSGYVGICQNYEQQEAWDKAVCIVNNLKGPEFPDREYSIVKFGAVGDGVTNNMKAINAAITTCSSDGGGRVLISGGIFITGPIHMKSNLS